MSTNDEEKETITTGKENTNNQEKEEPKDQNVANEENLRQKDAGSTISSSPQLSSSLGNKSVEAKQANEQTSDNSEQNDESDNDDDDDDDDEDEDHGDDNDAMFDTGFGNEEDDEEDDDFQDQLAQFEDTGYTEQDMMVMAENMEREFTSDAQKDEQKDDDDDDNNNNNRKKSGAGSGSNAYDDEDNQEEKHEVKKVLEPLQTIESERFQMSKKFTVIDHPLQDRLDQIIQKLKTDVMNKFVKAKSQQQVRSTIRQNFRKIFVGHGKYCVALSFYHVKLGKVQPDVNQVEEIVYILYINPNWEFTIVFEFANAEDYCFYDAWVSPLGTHMVISLEHRNRAQEMKTSNVKSDSGYKHFYINAFGEEYQIRESKGTLKSEKGVFMRQAYHILKFKSTEMITSVGWDIKHYQCPIPINDDVYRYLSGRDAKYVKQTFFESGTVLFALQTNTSTQICGMTFKYNSNEKDTYTCGTKMSFTNIDYKRIIKNTILEGFINSPIPITGIDIARDNSKTVIIISSAVYALFYEWEQDITVSGGSYAELFEMYNDGRKEVKSIMLSSAPIYFYGGPFEFTLLRNSEVGSSPSIDDVTAFAWISSEGIVHGDFLIDDIDHTISPQNYSILPHPWETLKGIVVSDFHIFSAYREAIKIIMQPPELKAATSANTLLSSFVYTDSLKSYSRRTNISRYRTMDVAGICKDHYRDENNFQQITVYSGDEVYLIDRSNYRFPEYKGVWKVYLEQASNPLLHELREDYYKKALDLCEVEDREHVRSALGDFYCESVDSEKLVKAAEYYSQTSRNFEEIVTKIMKQDPKSETDALMLYLHNMLGRLQDDSSVLVQKICLCIWLIELYLHKINLLTHKIKKRFNSFCTVEERKRQVEEYRSAISGRKETRMHFRKFLQRYKEVLSSGSSVKKKKSVKEVVYDLIESNGLESDTLYFACLIGDYDKVLRHLVARGNISRMNENTEDATKYYHDAHSILEKFCTDKLEGHDKLWYYHTPTLLCFPTLSQKLLENFKGLSNILYPKHLLPSLLIYISSNPLSARKDVKEYLKWAIDRKIVDETETIIHNTFVWLQALSSENQEELLKVLNLDQDDHAYDRDFASRVCVSLAESIGTDAVINLYSAMGLYEQAVEQALKKDQMDYEDATRIVNKITENRNLKRKLLLNIIRHKVARDAMEIAKRDKHLNRSSAIKFLNEFSDGIINLRDILHFFPSSTKISYIVDDLREALGSYEKQSEHLRNTIFEGSNDSQIIRANIKSVRIERDLTDHDKCDACSNPILSSQDFYLFSCNHYFHAQCLTELSVSNLEKRCTSIEEIEENEFDGKERRKLAKTRKKLSHQINNIKEWSKSINVLKNEMQFRQFKNFSEKKLIGRRLNDLNKALSESIASSCPYDGMGSEHLNQIDGSVSLVDLLGMDLFTREDQNNERQWFINDPTQDVLSQ